MKRIAFVTVYCWRIVAAYFVFFTVTDGAPEKYVWIASIVFGLGLLLVVGYMFRRLYSQGGFEIGWFLGAKRGGWFIFGALTGVCLLISGAAALIVPEQMRKLEEAHGMQLAVILVFLFWFALIATFGGWALICFSEVVGYLRLNDLRSALLGVGLGCLWVLFAFCCLWLFLDVINENFISISEMARYWILTVFSFLTVGIGLFAGRYENLEALEKSK